MVGITQTHDRNSRTRDLVFSFSIEIYNGSELLIDAYRLINARYHLDERSF